MGCVDGLRGYLALPVLIHHAFIWTQLNQPRGSWAAPTIPFLNQLGAGAVALCFMTTGLVFYPRILKGFTATSWPGIYISRVLRLVPLIIFSVALITVLILLRTGTLPGSNYPRAAATWISTYDQPPLLGFQDSGRMNATVLWSLWCEWLFYLFGLPASAAAMDLERRRQLPTWFVPMALLGIGLGARLVGKLLDIHPGIFFYLPLFAAGMIAWEIQARRDLRAALSKSWVAMAAGAGLLIGMAITRNPYSLSLPLFALFFACVASGTNFGGLLSSRGALVLGECSFSIYLLHGTVLYLLFTDASTPPTLLLPVAAVAVALLAPLTYLLIERPAMRFGKSLLLRRLVLSSA